MSHAISILIKKIINITFMTSIFFIVLFAYTPERENNSSVKPEPGWRFGDTSLLENKKKKNIKELLEEILRINKEQLKVQKKIYALLKSQYDPEPKKIKLPDGTECIENSSAECFNMPLTPEAKRIPVLRKWLSEPTEENAKEWLRWQAKYFKQVFDVGNSLQFAIAKWGDKAYPMSFYRGSFDTPGGYSAVLEEKNNRYVLNALAGQYELLIFFGKNWQTDLYSFDSYARLIQDLPQATVTLVFYSEGSRKVFEDAAKTLKNLNNLLERSHVVVAKEYFSKFHIYATPTLVVKLKDQKVAEPVVVGKLSAKEMERKILDLLEYKGVLGMSHSPDFKAWQRSGDYASQYLKHYYGLDVNETFIEKHYKGE